MQYYKITWYMVYGYANVFDEVLFQHRKLVKKTSKLYVFKNHPIKILTFNQLCKIVINRTGIIFCYE